LLDPVHTAIERPGARVPIVRRFAGHDVREVLTLHPRRLARPPHETLGIEVDAREDTDLRTVRTQASHERPGVDALDGRKGVAREICPEPLAGAPARRPLAVFAHDETAYERSVRLDVVGVHADVADLGIGHRHELALVGGVGKDLLIAGHAGVEDQLADRLGGRAERTPPEHGAVGQGEDRVAHEALRSATVRSSCTSRPPTSTIVARPTRSHPPKGVLRDFDLSWRTLTVQRCAGSTSVRSAGAPTASVPPGTPRMRAGPVLMRANRVGTSSTPSATSLSPSASAVSRPTTPLAAWSNSQAFSSA